MGQLTGSAEHLAGCMGHSMKGQNNSLAVFGQLNGSTEQLKSSIACLLALTCRLLNLCVACLQGDGCCLFLIDLFLSHGYLLRGKEDVSGGIY